MKKTITERERESQLDDMASVPLQFTVDVTAQWAFNQLQNLSELLPDKTDQERCVERWHREERKRVERVPSLSLLFSALLFSTLLCAASDTLRMSVDIQSIYVPPHLFLPLFSPPFLSPLGKLSC